MRLRPLEARDAEGMLSWMHDPLAVSLLSANFAAKTREDCLAFIAAAANPGPDRHWAIADDADVYVGTVSLKGIDPDRGAAEFAIVVRREAWGKGFSGFALRAVLEKAFGEFGLSVVYWYVNRLNARAVRFYEKQGFSPLSGPPEEARGAVRADGRMVWFEARSPAGEESGHG